MRAASRAAGRRSRRSTGQATGDRAAMRPVRAFTSLRRRGRPSDRRWPYRLHLSASARLTGADRLQLLGLARVTLAPALWPTPPRRDRRAGGYDLHHSRLGAPAISLRLRARLLRGARGAVTPRAVPLAARSRSACSLAVAADPSPAIGLALRCLGPKTAGGPPAGRSRRRGLGGSPSTCTTARNGKNRGGTQRGEMRSPGRGRVARLGRMSRLAPEA